MDTRAAAEGVKASAKAHQFPGQVVLVFQGGGALGAYHAGVYEAFHEARIEPDWVIGTSIGAINGAIIAGNDYDQRIGRLRQFWDQVERKTLGGMPLFWSALFGAAANLETLATGIPGFFAPNPAAGWGLHAHVGVESAAFYSTDGLKATLLDLVDFERLRSGVTRFTVGAVNVRTGEMRYFDSRDMAIGPEHVMGSSALPPAFPAIRADGEPHWDGGIYSNTPIEAVFDDYPRKSSVVFAVQVWHSAGPEPESIWQVLGRQKDIQYASRNKSHIARQKQIHQLRHVIRELTKRLPASERSKPDVEELAGYGCGTVMHIVQLRAPRLEDENYLKDIDFTRHGIEARWQAGHADARRELERKPWLTQVDPASGVAVHDIEAQRDG